MPYVTVADLSKLARQAIGRLVARRKRAGTLGFSLYGSLVRGDATGEMGLLQVVRGDRPLYHEEELSHALPNLVSGRLFLTVLSQHTFDGFVAARDPRLIAIAMEHQVLWDPTRVLRSGFAALQRRLRAHG